MMHTDTNFISNQIDQRDKEEGLFRNILLRVVDNAASENKAPFAVNYGLSPLPDVIIDEVGKLQYPLSHEQARSIIAIAHRAPFGKGSETIVDDAIRKVWEVDDDNVHIDEQWISTELVELAHEACDELGVMFKEHVEAKFHKLLLYEEGCHFKQHQDTEREAGMFATLLIQLPSKYTGGDLVITHNGAVARISNAENSENTPYYTAFFSDCKHTLEPVTSGYRIVLAFNLFLRVPGTVSESMPPISYQSVQASLQVAAHAWVQAIEQYPDVATKKLFHVLEHEYTEKSLSFINLKGVDHYVANTLRYAKDSHGEPLFQVYLALLCKHEEGTGADDEYPRRKRSHVEMERGCDVSVDYSLHGWVGVEGKVELNVNLDMYMELLQEYGYIEGDDDFEVFPDNPSRKEYEGYMGNYAGTLEQWYHKAVLAFWPTSADFDIKIASNVHAALLSLTNMKAHNDLFLQRLDTMVAEFEKRPISLLGDTKGNLLSLVDDTPRALRVLKLYESIGLPSNQVAHAISSLAEKLEWSDIADSIRDILVGGGMHDTPHGYALTLLGDLHRLHPTTSTTRASYEEITYNYLNKLLAASADRSSPPSNICVVIKLICLCSTCHGLWKQCENRFLRSAKWHILIQVLQGCLSIMNFTSAPEYAETRLTMLHNLEDITLKAYNDLPNPSVKDMLTMLQCLIPLNNTSAITVICEQFKASSPSAEQYRQFLQNPNVKKAIHDEEGPLRHLARHRMELLQEICRVPPTYNWTLPTAIHPHTGIQDFLRSCDATREIHGFTSIKAARDAANNYSSASLRVTAAGCGKNAHITCHKISTGHVMEAYEANREERNLLAAMLTTAETPNIST